jgi:hypothetical protein
VSRLSMRPFLPVYRCLRCNDGRQGVGRKRKAPNLVYAGQDLSDASNLIRNNGQTNLHSLHAWSGLLEVVGGAAITG